MINGISGSDKRYGDKEWLGFYGDDLEITIDLGKETEIKSLASRFFNSPGVWVYSPKEFTVSCENSKGEKVSFSKNIKPENNNLINIQVNLAEKKNLKTRYIKLSIPSYGMIPDGLQGAGHNAWTFIDEIVIE